MGPLQRERKILPSRTSLPIDTQGAIGLQLPGNQLRDGLSMAQSHSGPGSIIAFCSIFFGPALGRPPVTKPGIEVCQSQCIQIQNATSISLAEILQQEPSRLQAETCSVEWWVDSIDLCVPSCWHGASSYCLLYALVLPGVFVLHVHFVTMGCNMLMRASAGFLVFFTHQC